VKPASINKQHLQSNLNITGGIPEKMSFMGSCSLFTDSNYRHRAQFAKWRK